MNIPALAGASNFESQFAAIFGLPDDVSEVDSTTPAPAATDCHSAQQNTDGVLGAEEPAPQNVGEIYASLLARQEAFLRQQFAVKNGLAEQEKAMRAELGIANGRTDRLLFEAHLVDEQVVRLMETKHEQVFNIIIALAENHFAPIGGTLHIDSTDAFEQPGCRYGHNAVLDPVALWRYLEATYGGDAAVRIAGEQLARKLNNTWYFNNREAIQESRGYVILNRGVSIDSIDKKYHNKNRLSYTSSEYVKHAYESLAAVAEWYEMWELAEALSASASSVWMNSSEIQSRAKYSHGPAAEVVVVTYTSRFEFRLKLSFAEKIQLLLGQYGQ